MAKTGRPKSDNVKKESIEYPKWKILCISVFVIMPENTK